MLLHDPGTRFTARAYGEPDDPIGCLYLNDQSSQNVQPKLLSTVPVGRIFRHRCRDVVVNPMTPVLVVVVTSTASDDVSAFFFSSRRRHTSSKRDWSSDVCSSD